MKILCVGPLWRGSNAGGLFKAMSRKGALIEVVDEFYHIPLSAKMLKAKILSKALRSVFIEDFNFEILNMARKFGPDAVLVYKGAFVKPQTLLALKEMRIKLYNFYPDVSFHTHGGLLKHTLGLYEKIFTTKTFGIQDFGEQLGVKDSVFIPHGYDPEIHKPIQREMIPKGFFCDVSFIGTYSPKKEGILSAIKDRFPKIDLKIWGTQWEKSTMPQIKNCLQNQGIFGDLYAAGIGASKINLGILSEQVRGASSGDLITSRTFHIPAAGGFLLHEKNQESILYFQEAKEAGFFENTEDLLDKIEYYLREEKERIEIAQAGMKRANKDHSLDQRAMRVLDQMGFIAAN